MILRTENSKKTAADFSRYFDFLTTAFGLRIKTENYSIAGDDKYIRVLRNEFVQVELAGDQSYFHAEIRQLINGEPQPYFQEEYNIGYEDLAILLHNTYNHSEFYPAHAGWIGVLENTAKLFRHSKEVFTTNKWVDTKRIEKLKDEAFFKQFGFRPSENKDKPDFFHLIRQHALQLTDKEFIVVLDSLELPPYHGEKLSKKIILEKNSLKIKISQRDWRDSYTVFYIEVDGIKKYEMDLNLQSDMQAAAHLFNEQLDLLISELS